MTTHYEQPMNETVRACLRLEALLKQNKPASIPCMLEIIAVLDRPDLKGKLSTLLANQRTKLMQLCDHPNIDANALQETIDEADALINALHRMHHLSNDLIQHPFIKLLRQQMIYPGGLITCNSPAYQAWLMQPEPDRMQQIHQWAQQLSTLEHALTFIMRLIRSSQKWEHHNTDSGFHHQKLDSNQDLQLIRIQCPNNILPEISVGAHLLVIHFTHPTFSEEEYLSSPASDVSFKLACCSEIL